MPDLDKFDELYDKFKKRKALEKGVTLKQVGFTNPENLPFWKDVKKDNMDFDTCEVCRQELEDLDIVEACPNCHYYFHYKHIREWLKIKATCPVCNK